MPTTPQDDRPDGELGSSDAYRKFVALAPDDASAPLVKQQLKILKAQQKAGSSLPPSG